MGTNLLTHSCASCARTCLRKFWFRFEVGIGRNKTAGALRVGGAIHLGWEKWRKGMARDEAILVALSQYGEVPEWADPMEWAYEGAMVRALLLSYTHYYQHDEAIKFIEVEKGFDLPLTNPETGAASRTFTRAGKIDGIVDWSSRVCLLEGKTTADSLDAESDYWRRLRYDPQPSQYILAARELGYDVQSCIYDVVHKPAMRPSSVPLTDADGVKIALDAQGQRVRTKDGKKWRETSDKAAGITLQVRQETPAEYEARIQQDISSRPEFYFQRREIPRLEDDLKEFQSELWQVGQMILNCRNKNIWFRNISRATCPTCEYEAICLNEGKIDTTPGAQLPAGYHWLTDLHPELEELQA